MKFDVPASNNPIDRMKVIGKATDRIDGPLKTTGTAPYAYERYDVAPNQAYGYVLGSAIATGSIESMDVSEAKHAPGVIGVVSTLDYEPVPLGPQNAANLFGGAKIGHYHQAIALVVAETFEQARAATNLIRVSYIPQNGRFDLEREAGSAEIVAGQDGKKLERYGDFEAAYAEFEVTLDAIYRTPAESHAMMEPHATIAQWRGDKLTVWTSNQMIQWAKRDLAAALKIPQENVRADSPYIGGGFGSKLFVRCDVVIAAIGARQVGRPVKVALQRPLIANNTTHRAATIQHIRLGASSDGRLKAIGHESISGNLPNGKPEEAVNQTKIFYAGDARMTVMRLAEMNLPEANAMRAPGEASGLMALEIAMDEMAEKLGMDPIEFRVVNDTQVDPMKPERPFSRRNLVECLKRGGEAFGWDKRRARPGTMQEGDWLIGMGVAAGYRANLLVDSAARVRLSKDGIITVETDMTDIGTGTYTILAQTAAEMMGVSLKNVKVILGDSDFPISAGSGGQWGANNSTSGVYAACVKLREQAAKKVDFDPKRAIFLNGEIRVGKRRVPLAAAAADGELVAEDAIEYGDLDKEYQQATFASHFVQVSVNRFTGVPRIDRMLAVCSAGRILNPKSARSQVIGAMTMGVGAALMEHLAIDKRFGFFVNHDLASYEVPVHADIPHQDVIFLDEVDPISSPMKAKGVGELGLCGVAAAVANAIYNATGIRVRDYPITLEKHLAGLLQG